MCVCVCTRTPCTTHPGSAVLYMWVCLCTHVCGLSVHKSADVRDGPQPSGKPREIKFKARPKADLLRALEQVVVLHRASAL